jgi:hypothetical protein
VKIAKIACVGNVLVNQLPAGQVGERE